MKKISPKQIDWFQPITGSLSIYGDINTTGNLTGTSNTKFGDTSDDVHQFTGSLNISGSVSATDGFTGSFSGDGTNLSNIPASGIIGLNLSQIATGSVTASVSTDTDAFKVTSGSSNLFYIGSNGNVGIGTTSLSQKLTVEGNISGSGNLDIDGNSTIDGNLTVGGIITAQEFHTEFVSSSIIYESGSTLFGNSMDDIHTFTGSISISGSISTPEYIDFKLDNNVTPQTGRLWWDPTNGTLDVGVTDEVVVSVGEELIYPYVVNGDTVNLPLGTLVMVDPSDVAQGQRLRVVRAVTNGTYRSDLIMGVTAQVIPENQQGYVTWFGQVRDVPINLLEQAGLKDEDDDWEEGDILYPDPIRPGGLTTVPPSTPNLKSTIAVLTTVNGNNANLLVRPSLGPRVQDINDVQINNLTQGELIMWDSGSGYYRTTTQLSGSYAITGSLKVLDSISGSGDLSIDYDTLYVDTTNDRVGVNRPAPDTSLHVYGNGITSQAPGNAVINIDREDNVNYSAILNYRTGNSIKWSAGLSDAGDFGSSTGNEYIIGQTKTTPVFLIDSTNNVGIGTTSPSYKLDVNGSAIVRDTLYSQPTVSSTVFVGNAAGSTTGVIELQSINTRRLRILSTNVNTTFESSNQTGRFIFNNSVSIAGQGKATQGLLVTGSLQGNVVDLAVTSNTASMDLDQANFFTLYLPSSSTTHLTATNIGPGRTVSLLVTQPATSGSLTYSDAFKFAGGIPYLVSATGSVQDMLSFVSFDGTSLYGSSLKNMS